MSRLWLAACLGCAVAQATTAGEAAFDQVPTVDLACTSCILPEQVAHALRRYGFFYLKGHGLPEALITEQFEQSRRLFDLPAADKLGMPFNATLDIGYLGSGGQSLDVSEGGSGAPADTKEGFMLTNNGVMDDDFEVDEADPLAGAELLWPPGLPDFKRIARRYFAGALGVNRVLNELMFASLGLAREKCKQLAGRPFAVLKMLRYMARGRAGGTATEEGGFGAGAHADWGTLTVLATDGTPGLQVELDGRWLDVPPRRGSLIINAGDQIAAWTNGHYRSARHRVVSVSEAPRYSTALFTYFDYNAVVHPLRRHVSPSRPLANVPMTTREWFQFKLRQSVGEAVADPNAKTPTCGANGTAARGEPRRSWSVGRTGPSTPGAVASGLDLLRASDEDLDGLAAAMHYEGRGLLVVRGQTLTPPELERVLSRLGPRAGFSTPIRYDRWPGQSPRLKCCPHLSILGNYRARWEDDFTTGVAKGEPLGEYKPAIEELREWHSDGSFLEAPKVAIALYAPADLPDALPKQGGMTAFASGAAAYEALEPAEAERLLQLGSVHSWCGFMRVLEARDPGREKASAEDCAAKPDVTWPLVRTHPLTGKRAIYINPKNALRAVLLGQGNGTADRGAADGGAADGGADDGRTVLKLARDILKSGVYRHLWSPGDLVLWDNRVLLHAATPFDASKEERLLLRAEYPGEPVYLF